MSETNPYAAPADVQTIVDVDNGVKFFRDGRFLIVRDGAELPETCVVTNEPAESGSWRKRVKIAWTPPWVYVLILVNVIVLLIVAMIVQKKARITYSVGSRSRRKIVLRRSIGFVLFLLCVALFFFGATADTDEMVGIGILGGFAALIASLIFFVIANPVKVVKFKNGWFRIKGCSPDFLDTLPQHLSPF
jgi:hypothetical protein